MLSRSSQTMHDLINTLKGNGSLKNKLVEQVMLGIDRKDFIQNDPYEDCPQILGYKATISAPHMHAHALEFLAPFLLKARNCLDVGSGSGYLTLAFSKLMPINSVSVGIEHIPELVNLSIQNITKNHKNFLIEKKVVILEGDGRLGYPDYGPYDCIHVGAAPEKIPQALLEQLAPNGILVIPVGPSGNQTFCQITKDQNGKIYQKDLFGVRYVPLTDKQSQLRGY